MWVSSSTLMQVPSFSYIMVVYGTYGMESTTKKSILISWHETPGIPSHHITHIMSPHFVSSFIYFYCYMLAIECIYIYLWYNFCHFKKFGWINYYLIISYLQYSLNNDEFDIIWIDFYAFLALRSQICPTIKLIQLELIFL